MLPRYDGKLELLPHAAADTDHPTRVAGAKQAVDQIIDAVTLRTVTNVKGSLPDGYKAGGVRKPGGVGSISKGEVLAAVRRRELMGELRELSETIAAIVGAFEAIEDVSQQEMIVERYRSKLAMSILRQNELLRTTGLASPATPG